MYMFNVYICVCMCMFNVYVCVFVCVCLGGCICLQCMRVLTGFPFLFPKWPWPGCEPGRGPLFLTRRAWWPKDDP